MPIAERQTDALLVGERGGKYAVWFPLDQHSGASTACGRGCWAPSSTGYLPRARPSPITTDTPGLTRRVGLMYQRVRSHLTAEAGSRLATPITAIGLIPSSIRCSTLRWGH